MLWSIRIMLARLRPLNAASVTRVLLVAIVAALFLWGDYVLFARLFRATGQIEAATPFFALGLLRNLLAMVFLVATVVLFSSAMTAAIGAYFTDLDLDIYHSAPVPKLRLVVSRWTKTFLQSATVVFVFLVPLFMAFARHYHRPWTFHPIVLGHLLLLLSIPVSVASLVIVMLVRWFPVRRVHQIVATIAVLVLTVAVVAFRVSRPERLFTEVQTDEVAVVLKAIELPSIGVYPGTALADLMVGPEGTAPGEEVRSGFLALRIVIPAGALLLLFLLVTRKTYFPAFVRARESMAPAAIGSKSLASWGDRLFARTEPQMRAMVGKEIRTITRDVAQWSQVFLMAALLFIYLYNIRMLPLEGDARATLVAYLNVGMAGFVVAAICLRFAYPSVSAEGKAFWMVQVAPISYRRLVRVKVLVYGLPLILVSLFLTALANVILKANPLLWALTLPTSALIAFTLVSLGVGMGALNPDFNAENPLQVGLSIGGFAYMALSMCYVAVVMLLLARPVMRYFFWRLFDVGHERAWLATAVPLVTVVTASLLLAIVPVLAAEKRLARLSQSG